MPRSMLVPQARSNLFIAIITFAVVHSRYAAVFPLFPVPMCVVSAAESSPTPTRRWSFEQVSVAQLALALAAGFKGRNVQTLRMTVLGSRLVRLVRLSRQ